MISLHFRYSPSNGLDVAVEFFQLHFGLLTGRSLVSWIEGGVGGRGAEGDREETKWLRSRKVRRRWGTPWYTVIFDSLWRTLKRRDVLGRVDCQVEECVKPGTLLRGLRRAEGTLRQVCSLLSSCRAVVL